MQMIQEISEDIKEFLLSYVKIQQLISLAQGELLNVNTALEAEIAKQKWFSLEFRTDKSYKAVQVWKKKWHPSETQGCPWIHFEYAFSWPDYWVLASLDIESVKIASRDAILKVSSALSSLLSGEHPNSLKASGWILKPHLEGNRMLLLKRNDAVPENFSAQWLFTTGIQLFNDLAEVIPYVDQAIKETFGER
jgi:hypothetical protein